MNYYEEKLMFLVQLNLVFVKFCDIILIVDKY